jgi:SAM-dependent methyltransferase
MRWIIRTCFVLSLLVREPMRRDRDLSLPTKIERNMRAAVLRQLYMLFDILFRNARNRQFIERMQLTPETTVLDVGGTPGFWRKVGVIPKLTILNVGDAPPGCEFTYVQGSACELPFPDKSFDIVFSNSMIEHLGSWDNQVLAAHEMERVGKRMWVQTPSRSFPIDPHFLTPFVHWLPVHIMKKVLPFTLAGMLWKLSTENAEALANEIRLLSKSEVHSLFPCCDIVMENVVGITKSIIAVGKERERNSSSCPTCAYRTASPSSGEA